LNGVIDAHCRVGECDREESRSVEAALREMDASGVGLSWICPPDVCAAVRNREGNALIARAVAAHPDRFVGCAVANPWSGQGAVAELRHAFEGGMRVLFLHPPVQGFQLSDPLVDPLIAVAQEHRAPVYAHTGTPVCAEPFQLAALARRHPEVRFIMGHMGFADFWYDAVPAAATSENIWLETSLMDGGTIADAAERLGVERLVFGSAAPLSALGAEIEKISRLPLPQPDVERILRHNAERLLP